MTSGMCLFAKTEANDGFFDAMESMECIGTYVVYTLTIKIGFFLGKTSKSSFFRFLLCKDAASRDSHAGEMHSRFRI